MYYKIFQLVSTVTIFLRDLDCFPEFSWLVVLGVYLLLGLHEWFGRSLGKVITMAVPCVAMCPTVCYILVHFET